MLQETPPRAGEGLVTVRGSRWRVLGVTSHEDCAAWQLAGADGGPDAATLLVPFDRPLPLRRDPRPRLVGRRRWVAALRALMASASSHEGLRTAAMASIELHPYQLEPVLACLHGAPRILIADEVGLGKTIQAGLIISELAARGEADGVLVVAPAGLCTQWRLELETRFHLAPAIVDAAQLRNLARWPSREAGPWQRVPLAIASVDFVKRPEVLRGISPARYDLLVVDEAHTCAHARERSAAIGWLARRSRRVVLLTATPHDGDAAAFDALCGLGRHDGEPPLAVFRRTRRSLGSAVSRRMHLLQVRLSPPEAALHAALERYTSRVWRVRAGDPRGRNARLAMVVLRKRAASGPTALLLSLGRRLEWLSRAREDTNVQLTLPLEPETDLDAEDAQPDALLAAPGLDDAESERRALRRLVDAARVAATHDSKVASLQRLLSRARQPAIVFTEYRDTLDRLAACLQDHGPLAILHGGVSAGERDAAVRAFNAGKAVTLLATDAAAHGLNLQSRCRLVVNVELPWNPVRLEQRIGRVDRIGQRRKVHGFNLVGAGTCEDRILARLVARIGQAGHCLGSVDALVGSPSEEQVAEAVFEGQALGWCEGPGGRRQAEGGVDRGQGPGGRRQAEGGVAGCLGASLFEPARREVERLERVRQLLHRREGRRRAALGGTRPGHSLLADLERRAPWFTVLRRGHGRGLAPGLWCVCQVCVTDGRGRVRDQALLALHAAGPAESLALPAFIAAGRPAIEGLAASASAARVSQVAGGMAAATEAQTTRERAIAAADSEPPSPVQPGLFDRRALALAERGAHERERAARELAARLDALSRGGRVADVHAELLLVLVVPV